MNEQFDIYKQIREHSYTRDNCFLCGCILNDDNRTEEHVIPKWLQGKFNLWNQHIILLNGTSIPYRLLTIPCCFECNNKYLNPFEVKVKTSFNAGYDEFERLDKETIFLWLGKIYFGIMYRELFLDVDRSNSENGTITTPEYVQTFNSHFMFLQGIRKRQKFKNFFPASIYFFKTQKSDKVENQWDFIDNHTTPFISIRMGEIGLIASLQDGEATKQLESLLEYDKSIELHPLQFREITAKILYKTILMNRTPSYMMALDNGILETFMMPLQGLSSKPIFDEWDNDFYAKLLSEITKVPLKICNPEKGKCWTWLIDINNKPIFIDINKGNE